MVHSLAINRSLRTSGCLSSLHKDGLVQSADQNFPLHQLEFVSRLVPLPFRRIVAVPVAARAAIFGVSQPGACAAFPPKAGIDLKVHLAQERIQIQKCSHCGKFTHAVHVNMSTEKVWSPSDVNTF
jgi:hypothetical protein